METVKLERILKEEAVQHIRVAGSVGAANEQEAYNGLIKWMGMMGKGRLFQAVRYFTFDMVNRNQIINGVKDPNQFANRVALYEFYATAKEAYEIID